MWLYQKELLAFNCHRHVETLGCELRAVNPQKGTEGLVKQSLFSSGLGRYGGSVQHVLVYCSLVTDYLT